MAEITQTFSESWYRIAGQKISLRNGINVRRQNFRGQRWIVLENPFNNQFFRIRPSAYEFLARLRPNRTVEEVWKECMNRFPDDAPGQESVIQLLSQLYYANLLQYDVGSDSAKMFERQQKSKQRETRGRLLSIMFMRFPLLDPDEFLTKTLPIVGKLISPAGAIIWLGVVIWGLKMAADNWTGLRDGSQGVLAPQNLFLLYIGLVIVKSFHEFGHAYFCRKFGGEVHAMGVQLMIFTPTPYMDATSAWGFRSRKLRVLVGAAGMIVELFVAAFAMFFWSRSGPGTFHNLCYNMLFVASVSTVMFNLIPLLRFDGYYILSDLLDIPNLSQRAMGELRHLVERYGFGVAKSESPATSSKEEGWLTVFGIASGIYRIFVFGRILLFVADRLLLIGIIMAVVCAISWVLAPTIKLFQYLASNPRLERCRPRAVAACIITAGLILIFLGLVPFPHHFRAPGVLEAHEWSQAVNLTAGFVDKIAATPGSKVVKGAPLVIFRSPELELDLEAAIASRGEAEARLLQAMKIDSASLKPLQSRLESVNKRIARLQFERDNLTVRARNDGLWVAPQMEESVGRWIARGTSLGLVVNPAAFEFVATVVQEDVDQLFAPQVKQKDVAKVRLYGQADIPITVSHLRRIPGEQRVLPSPALGWAAGGDIPIAKGDTQGQKAAEPFFEVRADVQNSSDAALVHGRAGKIRFDLPAEPLLPRWIRRLQQLLQKRYQL